MLKTLSEYEISLLKSFQERIDELYMHERYVYQLVRRLSQLRGMLRSGAEKKETDEFFEKEVKGKSKALKSEILAKFDILKPRGKEDEEEQIRIYERKKKQHEIDPVLFLKNAYDRLVKGEDLIKGERTRAERKMKRALRKLKKEIKEEGRGMGANEKIMSLIEDLHEFRETMYNFIYYEYQLFEDIKKCFLKNEPAKEKAEEIEEIERKLRVLISSIKRHLRAEKDEVYKPLLDLIGKEVSGSEAFARLKKKTKKITLEDIKADLYTMTDAVELNDYLSALKSNKELVEEKAWPHIYNYELKAKEIIENIKKASVKDALTGLFTRRIMNAQLDNLILRSAGTPGTFSVVMSDIDNFKSVNDDLGHRAGDNVLKRIATVLQATARASDIICRYGGEEFVIILPRCRLAKAIETAERIRRAVEESNFDLKDKRNITISVGVAEYDGRSTKEEIIEKADKRLYKAKAAGKNRVVYD